MRFKNTLLIFALFAFFQVQAQDQGYIDGKVYLDTEEKAAYTSTVRVFQGNKLIMGTTVETDGFFRLKPLSPGKYQVVVSFVGYHNDTIIDVPVKPGSGTDLGKVILLSSSTMLGTATVKASRPYKAPLIDKNGAMKHSMDNKQLETLPNPTDVISNLQYISSEFQVDPGTKEVHFRGSRAGETAYYVDGVRVDSPEGIPKFAIASLTVYAGGVPARFGDFTGGVVEVETKSYFDWEQEQKVLIKQLEYSKAPKTEKKESKEENEDTHR